MDSGLAEVIPLPGYCLELRFRNGSSAVVNMTRRVNTLRFSRLAEPEMFRSARASGNKVVWTDGKHIVSAFCNELLDTMLMD